MNWAMNRKIKRGLVVLFLVLAGSLIMAADGDAEIPFSLRNNRYYTESLRLANLAKLAYDAGEYESSAQYSEEAIRYANLSDEYVRLQLKIQETDRAIYAAGRRLETAVSMNVPARFPAEYNRAQAAYGEARAFRTAESWDAAIEAANRVILTLAFIDGGAGDQIAGSGTGGGTTGAAGAGGSTLPAQYTVRTWELFRDCLWNIAGRPWAYNDPFQWKRLYDANKAKMPQSENADLIQPGMVLDIPSIKGETRQGMWDSSQSYLPLP